MLAPWRRHRALAALVANGPFQVPRAVSQILAKALL
jgi:hypothetical protein